MLSKMFEVEFESCSKVHWSFLTYVKDAYKSMLNNTVLKFLNTYSVTDIKRNAGHGFLR